MKRISLFIKIILWIIFISSVNFSNASDITSIKNTSHKQKIQAGKGFYYSNISLKKHENRTECLGEISNNSGRNYAMAIFRFSVYDDIGKLIGAKQIMIQNIENGMTKSFSEDFYKISSNIIVGYKIQYETGY